MNLDIIILFVLLGVFFAALILVVKLFSVVLFKYKVQSHGIEVDWKEAQELPYPTCLKKEFLNQAIDIIRIENTDFRILCNHFLASGDLENVKAGITELKAAGVNYEIKDLLTIDLAGRKIKGNIAKYQKNGKLDAMEALVNWKE